MPTPAPLLLKVLSGPHVGAEVALRDGEIIIGSGEECDVILSDTFISAKHLKLDIRSGEARAQGLAENTFLDGKPLNGHLTGVANFQLLTIGGTHLMLGPKGVAWPAPKTQMLPALVGGAAAPVPPQPSAAAPAASAKPAVAAAPVTPPGRRGHLILGAIGFVLLVAALVAAYLMLPESGPAPVVDLVREVQQRLATVPSGKKLAVQARGRGVLVQGQVENAEQRRQVLAALAPLGEKVGTRIVSQEQLFESARQLLRTLQVPVEAVALEPGGALVVRGIVKTRDDWARALAHLRQDLPGLEKVNDSQVLAIPQLLAKVGEVLKDLEIGQVQGSWADNVLALRGVIDEGAVEVWKSFGQRLSEKVGFPVELHDEVKVASLPGAAPMPPRTPGRTPEGGAISSIVLDKMNWVVLKNGKRLFVGSALPSGYTVERITPDGVKITNGRETKLMQVGDDLWAKP